MKLTTVAPSIVESRNTQIASAIWFRREEIHGNTSHMIGIQNSIQLWKIGSSLLELSQLLKPKNIIKIVAVIS